MSVCRQVVCSKIRGLRQINALDPYVLRLKLTEFRPRGGGGTLGISGWGCAAGTLEPLTYTRASSGEFFYPILE